MDSPLPLLQPREEKTPPLVFDSCPKLHRPYSSGGRQPLLTQGAGHERKSIRDKNQLLSECAAAIDTRARRGAPFSRDSSSSDRERCGGRGGVGEMSHGHPRRMSVPRARATSSGLDCKAVSKSNTLRIDTCHAHMFFKRLGLGTAGARTRPTATQPDPSTPKPLQLPPL
jgi:hypothetical protein